MCTCFDNAEQSCKENLYTIFSQLPAKIMDRLANIYFQGVANSLLPAVFSDLQTCLIWVKKAWRLLKGETDEKLNFELCNELVATS